jgi:hypothetical protein
MGERVTVWGFYTASVPAHGFKLNLVNLKFYKAAGHGGVLGAAAARRRASRGMELDHHKVRCQCPGSESARVIGRSDLPLAGEYQAWIGRLDVHAGMRSHLEDHIRCLSR